MSSLPKIQIKDFSLGMQPSQRSNQQGSASLVKNFDISTDNQKLIPVTTYESWVTDSEKDIGIVCIGGYSQGSTTIYGVGNALESWFSTKWSKRVMIKPKHTQEGDAEYGYLDLSNMPSEFWSTVNEDGSDIRMTDKNHASIKHYLLSIDKDAQTGKLVFAGEEATDTVYLYFGNSEADDASTFEDIWSFRVDHAFPMHTNLIDYQGTFNLDEGADWREPETSGYLGNGTNQTSTMRNDYDDGFNMGDDGSFTLIFRANQKPASEVNIVTDTTTMDMYITTSGTIRFACDVVSGSVNITGSVDVCDGEYHLLTVTYNEHSETASIMVDGSLDNSITSSFDDLDHDQGTVYVRAPLFDSVIEFLMIRRAEHKDLDDHKTEYDMLFDNSNFYVYGDVESFETVGAEYDHVQMWQKSLGDANWTEYLEDGLPVKDDTFYPKPSFVIREGGHLWTVVDNDASSTFSYLSKIGFNEIDWSEDLILNSEGYPRTAYPVDKKYYVTIDGISSISGEVLTNGVFSAYATPNHITPYGQYLAIAVDRGNQSFAHLWDLDSTTSREFIDFGAGRLRAIGSLYGALFGIVNNSLDNEKLANGKQSMDIRIWQGGASATPFLSFESPKTLETEETDDFNQPVLNQIEYIKNGMIFWAKIYDKEGQLHKGFWAITKNEKNGVYAFSLLTSTDELPDIQQFFRTGNVILFVDGQGGVYKTSTSDYSATSIWESVWLDGTSIEQMDQLASVEATFEPLDENQEIKIEYRLPNTDWKTIFTHKKANSEKREAKKVESDNTQLPSFQQIKFRVTSTGGKSAILSLTGQIEDLLDE